VLVLRPVETRDLDDLMELASGLDSVNLPRDADFLAERIAHSVRSFAALSAGDESVPRAECVYVFALEDAATGHCVGTSLILAKHGRPGAPYYWLQVSSEERRSPELDRRFVHMKLQLRSTEDGPTEVGGLVLAPSYRHHASRCGKALSIVRFAFISAHSDRFEREVIAEMLSPFDAPGQNRLWDAFGARFTGLPYREADHLSARTKQFIADLFPRDPVYVTLFPEEVQKTLGQPNDQAKPAVRILEKVGFHPLNQVDPFDGGPYYGAARDAIVSVRERREFVLPGETPGATVGDEGPLALLSAEGSRGFRATVVPLGGDGAPRVSEEVRGALGVASGDRVSITPLP
jgi:arginine N-succinyltransferase